MSLRSSRATVQVPYAVSTPTAQSAFSQQNTIVPQFPGQQLTATTTTRQQPVSFTVASQGNSPYHSQIGTTQVVPTFVQPTRASQFGSPSNRSNSANQYYQEIVQLPVIVQKEVQIVEDTQKIDNLQDQLNQTNQQKADLANELEVLKNKPPVIQEKIKIVQDNTMIDSLNHRLGDVVNDNNSLIKSVQSKDNENSKLKYDLQDAGLKIQMLENDKENLKRSLNTVMDNNKALQDKLNEVVPLYHESESKAAVLDSKLNAANNNIDMLQKGYSDLNDQNAQLMDHMNDLGEKVKKSAKTGKQNQDLKGQVDTLAPQLAQAQVDIASLQNRIAEQDCEIDSLKSSNNLLTQQNQISKNQVDELSAIVKECVPALQKSQNDCNSYKQQVNDLSGQLAFLQGEWSKLSNNHANALAEIESLKSSNGVLTHQNQISCSENDHLKEIVKKCLPELSQCKEENSQLKGKLETAIPRLEQAISDNSQLSVALNNANIEVSNLSSTNNVLTQQNKISASQIESQNQKINSLIQELNHVTAQNDNKAQQLAQITPRCQQSEADNKRYIAQIEQLLAEISSMKQSNTVLTNQNIISSQDINNLKQGIAKLAEDIQIKDKIIQEKAGVEKRLFDKERAFNDLKFQFDDISSQLKLKIDLCNDLQRALNDKSNECYKKDQVISDLQAQISEFKFQIERYQSNQQQLESVIAQLKSSLQASLTKITDLSASLEQKSILLAQYEQKIMEMAPMIQMLTIQRNELVIEVEHLQSHEERLAILHKELEAEKMLTLSKIRDNDKLVNQISRLEAQLKQARQSGQVNYTLAGSLDFSEEKLLCKDDVNKRSKLAIAQADNLKFGSNSQSNSLANSQYTQPSYIVTDTFTAK